MMAERSKSQFFGSGAARPHLQNFEDKPDHKIKLKPHEKRSIVSHFLHNDLVLSHLCEWMFKTDEKDNNFYD